MKYSAILLIVLFTFCGPQTIDYKIQKGKYALSASLGSCFNNDSIIVLLNDVVLLEKESVVSDKIIGMVGMNFQVYQSREVQRVIFNDGNKKILKEISSSSSYKLTIIRNNYKNDFFLNLKKGKKIIIDGCKDIHQKKVEINYYKKTVFLE